MVLFQKISIVFGLSPTPPPFRNSSLAPYLPLKILVFDTPTPSEFPMTFHRVGMDIFWNCSIDIETCIFRQRQLPSVGVRPGGGGGVLPYIGYIGMCGAKGYGFSAALVINRASNLAILPPFW